MDLFENILHTITWGIASLVDTIYRAFLYLSGITVIQNNQANQGQNIIGNDFLSSLLNAKFGAGNNITFNTIYLQFMFFGILILGITLIIATIKTFINKEDEVKSRNLVYQKAGSSLLEVALYERINTYKNFLFQIKKRSTKKLAFFFDTKYR